MSRTVKYQKMVSKKEVTASSREIVWHITLHKTTTNNNKQMFLCFSFLFRLSDKLEKAPVSKLHAEDSLMCRHESINVVI